MNDKTTLSKRIDQLTERIDQLTERMDQLTKIVQDGFKQDRMTIATLANEMRAGFKQVNTRLDNLEVRVDRIEKRLDYNNLKPLPKESR